LKASRSRGALRAQQAAQIVLGIISALTAFHQAGIIHRDLKPGNVLLSASGAKLLGFGLAKQVSLHAVEETAAIHSGAIHPDALHADATHPGTFLGTPRYASPEQFRSQPVDARSDLFSLGAIFFEMLTGEPAFSGQSLGEVEHSVLYGSPPALTGSPAISAMGRIVHRALERDPRNRYTDADPMAADLRLADIGACYQQWKAKGAQFLTEPLDNHGHEWRCYMRDPDGYLIEVGQYTQLASDRFAKFGG
jgi:serine/threonine protein kinase